MWSSSAASLAVVHPWNAAAVCHLVLLHLLLVLRMVVVAAQGAKSANEERERDKERRG